MRKGIVVAVIHCAFVLSLAGKYALDRALLPREWVRCAPFDPNVFVRGRYISLRLIIDPDDKLLRDRPATINGPVAFFIPEHAEDPSRRQLKPGEELWVEVTVPPRSLPRPLRLGIKKDGIVNPLP